MISPRQQYLSKSCDTNEDVSSNIFGHLESEENSICGDNQASNNINQQTHNNKSKISTPTGSLKLSKQKSSSSPDLSSSTYSSSHFDFERDLQEQPQNIEQNNLHQAFENKNSKFKILETSYSTDQHFFMIFLLQQTFLYFNFQFHKLEENSKKILSGSLHKS